MSVYVNIEVDGQTVKIKVAEGSFLGIEALSGLDVEIQREIAPSIEIELKDFIKSKEEQANKAKKLPTKVYQLLSNEQFRASVKARWEKEIEEKNTTKAGKPRKKQLTEAQEFEIKNEVIDEVARFTGGDVGIWNSYNYWQVNADINVTNAKRNLETIKPLLDEVKEPVPDWIEEALKDLKSNKGK